MMDYWCGTECILELWKYFVGKRGLGQSFGAFFEHESQGRADCSKD